MPHLWQTYTKYIQTAPRKSNVFKNAKTVMCLRMRKLRGDADMLMRELPKVKVVIPEVEKGQKRLFEVISCHVEL